MVNGHFYFFGHQAGKTVPKEPKKWVFQKLAQNPPKSEKWSKLMSIPPFWGMLALKIGLRFFVLASEEPFFGI